MSDDADDDDDLPPAELELRQTRLRVEDGELVRRQQGGGVAMRVPLDDLERVRFVRAVNPISFLGLAVAGGLVGIGAFVSEFNVVSVILYVMALLLAAFCVVGLRGDTIELKLRGETVRVQCPDPTDEVIGFAASLRARCGGR